MRLKISIFLLITVFISTDIYPQSYLSNLKASNEDPLFTTYAAPIERSEFKIDQGYELLWYEPDKPVMFVSSDGGNIGVIFSKDGELRWRLEQFFEEPVVSTSFSDLVKFYYYPFKYVKVEISFAVYGSSSCIYEICVTNESRNRQSISLFPFFDGTDANVNSPKYDFDRNRFEFRHSKKRDIWMVEHSIPFVENLFSAVGISPRSNNYAGFHYFEIFNKDDSPTFISNVYFNNSLGNRMERNSRVFSWQYVMNLPPGEKKTIRIVRATIGEEKNHNNIKSKLKKLYNVKFNKLISKDERIYSGIPAIKFLNEEDKLLYYSAFSLMRQCMMPPEGECGYNYYVFSREPKWGWGYGGQVFHESLSMLAYVFMDGESTMNSQRVFFERQHPNGYINYRTGPYLNETIETNGQLTTSAPWLNWENLEIYKVTKDIGFLREAYQSGKKFYNFFIENRDSDSDGLCEWGGAAGLESVRDARVAVWDQVGSPENFEALDLNSMLVKEAASLAQIADILGLKKEAEKWRKEVDKRAELIRQTMWDSDTGFFYNIDKVDNDFSFKNSNDLKIKEIIGFLPLWAGAASESQASELIRHLKNKSEFWRRFGIPSLSADEDYYNPIGYWNGPVWVQWQYLIFRGLLDYGYINEARKLTERISKNIKRQLSLNHNFYEFYSADDYQAGWHKTYIWTGIIARMMIDLETIRRH